MGRRVLLACGIFSSLFYVVTDIAGTLSWNGYSYTSQNISELLAIGSPTRSFLFAPSSPTHAPGRTPRTAHERPASLNPRSGPSPISRRRRRLRSSSTLVPPRDEA